MTWTRWTDGDVDTLKRLWAANAPIRDIEAAVGRTRGNIYAKATALGLPARRRKRKTPKVPHGGAQRRYRGVEHRDGPRIVLADHHPAARDGTTFFPGQVKPAAAVARMLKSGINSRKIGAKVTKGPWKGFPLFTLTLEERRTCPRTCKEWTTCYGNNMQWATRISDDGTLTARLFGELSYLAVEHPRGFGVRLHVLGDFYSVGYVEFWRTMLDRFPQLHIFGFTARLPPDPIGVALVRLTRDHYNRFRMRFSGAGYEDDCSEVVDTLENALGVPCPAQSDPDRCCSTCALCMNSNRTITFLRH